MEKEFIKVSYEPYSERFGNEITGFFTDEPQFYRWATPYTPCAERYFEDIRDGLIWLFVPDNGFVKVFNPYTGKYLGEPGDNSTNISVVDAATAANYTLEVNVSGENADAKIKLTCNGKSVHMAEGGSLVRWDNGGASQWTISEVTDFTDIATAYKNTALATLDQWATLSVVFDAATISAAKVSIDVIDATSWASFAAIDAELKKVTDNVATKMFTFQTTATDNHRYGVWVSANMSTNKAIGAHSQDYNAIWSLRHAGGTSFYMFNLC